jgi:HEAT repeat protein
LAQLKVGGPTVEKLFRKCLAHPQANVRKEALPGIAQLLKSGAAVPVAEALNDVNLEVKKRAAACLGLTGIADQSVYKRLADILSAKDCSEEFAVQIVASINRLKLQPPESPALEIAMIGLLGTGGFLGVGGRKGSASPTLRLAVVQALGFVGTSRSRKALARLSANQGSAMIRAVAEALEKLTVRSG